MTPNAYSSLHESVRRWIDEKQWTDFTQIQAAAIPAILSGHGALLVAPTAGGKTEAALLPIVSKILEEQLPPISLLYIAPLRALINDQAMRAELLLRDTPLRSAWWHGDLTHARRMAIARDLPDALMTTPESLEVHLSSGTYYQGGLLTNVRFVLVDEIHAFAENDRGAQLMSLLTRLEALMKRPFARIGLSATIGNPETVATWFISKRPDAPGIDVLRQPGAKKRKLHVGLIALPKVAGEEAHAYAERCKQRSYEVVAEHVRGRRSIVFVTSRSEAENLTSRLRAKGIETLIHHGSLSVEMRAAAEEAMKRDEPKTIVATSTLELGIDIGDLEQVLQLGPVGSVASWLQRIGRSGRASGATSIGLMYALNSKELPKAIALCDLANAGDSETLSPDRHDFNVAFHQVLNLVRERDRLPRAEIVSTLAPAGSFDLIEPSAWETLLDEMIADGYIELEGGLIQLGVEAERAFGFASFRDFYSVFTAESGWVVKHGQSRVGSLPESYPMSSNQEVRFVLGGTWWRVVAIDAKAMVVQVEPVAGGKAPTWQGGAGETSFEVMQRTAALLAGDASPFITQNLQPHMSALVESAAVQSIMPGRIVVGEQGAGAGIEVITYAGNRVNQYLQALVSSTSENKTSSSASETGFKIGNTSGLSTGDVYDFIRAILSTESIRQEAEERALKQVEVPTFGKYGSYLGPRSRVAAWRGRFKQLPHLEDLLDFEVVERSIKSTAAAK